MFLAAMPKGGDLNNHGGGAIYAEDFLPWAAKDGLCIATDNYRIVGPPCDAPNRVPAAGLEYDYPRYSRAIDALSTRGFETGVGDPTVSGYDRFFAPFAAFWIASPGNIGKMMARTREQAASDHVGYVELSSGAPGHERLVAALADVEPTEFGPMFARIA